MPSGFWAGTSRRTSGGTRCATHLVANGANIVYVQRLLGHKSLKTTEIYTRVTMSDLKKTLQRTHPRARRRSAAAPGADARGRGANARRPRPMATLNPTQPSTAPKPGAGGSTLDTLSARYLQHLESLNYSPQTLATKRGLLQSVRRVFGRGQNHRPCKPSRPATLPDFQRWIFYQPTVQGTARSVSSQNHVLSAIRNFFTFLHQEGYLAHNPAQGLRLSKEPDALPKNVLTPEEARKIIEAPDTHTRVGYRDRTLLEVLYATGIRKAELRNLRWTP